MSKYGYMGVLRAQPGKRDELAGILLEAAGGLQNYAGCLLYVVTKDEKDEDAVRVWEIWESKEEHDNSLKLPATRELITKAMPLLNGMPEGTALEVLGGKGSGF
ncbi:antibiotic biosynthesis monooxygenase [Chitinophaga alhagiae]|uniref:Antibiotic biosynthesis monooxygenase n=1 Tax=Chitinophaga alhagiae TaxID=2203219 RepID=A0ABM6W9T0_9BACT|nr:putative quinol monooxygenase [Chitinophaga alhagiae]AWO00645.1 antibiotic biosynthesis monooxygenase [Chitinophaga alhagiae]